MATRSRVFGIPCGDRVSHPESEVTRRGTPAMRRRSRRSPLSTCTWSRHQGLRSILPRRRFRAWHGLPLCIVCSLGSILWCGLTGDGGVPIEVRLVPSLAHRRRLRNPATTFQPGDLRQQLGLLVVISPMQGPLRQQLGRLEPRCQARGGHLHSPWVACAPVEAQRRGRVTAGS